MRLHQQSMENAAAVVWNWTDAIHTDHSSVNRIIWRNTYNCNSHCMYGYGMPELCTLLLKTAHWIQLWFMYSDILLFPSSFCVTTHMLEPTTSQWKDNQSWYWMNTWSVPASVECSLRIASRAFSTTMKAPAVAGRWLHASIILQIKPSLAPDLISPWFSSVFPWIQPAGVTTNRQLYLAQVIRGGSTPPAPVNARDYCGVPWMSTLTILLASKLVMSDTPPLFTPQPMQKATPYWDYVLHIFQNHTRGGVPLFL